ncbi:MAG: hypothetical protein DRP20_00320, partial [Thermotogae bacterium]
DIFDTELAIDEAIANVITHTYDNDPTKYVLMTLKWEYATTKLSVLIRDFGPSVNPAVLKPGQFKSTVQVVLDFTSFTRSLIVSF